MKEDTNIEKSEAPPVRDFGKDPNNQARIRAGRRSNNVLSGKDSEEGLNEVPDTIIPETETEGYMGGGKVEGYEDGGIVAEAEKEKAAVDEATETETPEVEAAEAETPAEEAAEAEMPEAEMSAESEMGAEYPKAMAPSVGEYMPPEGETHDVLIDRYHEALALGDVEQARTLYKQLQEHRFQENTHRAKSDSQAMSEAEEYVRVSNELVMKHPELGEDGLQANKALALADVYRRDGMSAADAITQAAADLYPEAPMEPESAVPEAPMEEEAPMEPEAAVPEAEGGEVVEPDMAAVMADRMNSKRNVVQMPTSSSRSEEKPAPKEPTRSDAIQQMKAKRGQL